jgi:hypothetical protein
MVGSRREGHGPAGYGSPSVRKGSTWGGKTRWSRSFAGEGQLGSGRCSSVRARKPEAQAAEGLFCPVRADPEAQMCSEGISIAGSP